MLTEIGNQVKKYCARFTIKGGSKRVDWSLLPEIENQNAHSAYKGHN